MGVTFQAKAAALHSATSSGYGVLADILKSEASADSQLPFETLVTLVTLSAYCGALVQY
jgi:hypothetical protein